MDLAAVLAEELRRRIDVIDQRVTASLDEESLDLEEQREFLRRTLPLVASLIAGRRWQAPAAAHSAAESDFAGGEQHAEEETPFRFAYARWFSTRIREREQAYLSSYGSPDFQECLLTSAGMAAVNLALEAILRRHIHDPVRLFTVGSIYGETYDQCCALAATRNNLTHLVVPDTDALLSTLRASDNAGAVRIICADAVENGPDGRIFDPRRLLGSTTPRDFDHPSYLILDRTLVGHLWGAMMGQTFQPTCWQIIEVESLTKYHQLGLDLATAGIIYFPVSFVRDYTDGVLHKTGMKALWRLRASLGLAPSDTTVMSFPSPSANRQERRLRRHWRNAALLAQAITASGPGRWRVTHPSLPSHPDCRLVQADESGCGLLFLQADAPGMPAAALVDILIRTARQDSLVLSQRASFGFNETSLDVWDENTVRVAAGTEPLGTALRLAELFRQVIPTC